MQRFDEIQVGDVIMAETQGWQDCRVQRVHADGTLTVVPLAAKHSFLSEWIGLTEEEVWLDDRERWSQVFATFAVERTMGVDEFLSAFEASGRMIARDAMTSHLEEYRDQHGDYDIDGQPQPRFDEEDAYTVLKLGGGTARSLDPAASARQPAAKFFKLYWNQLRMGGRDPAECPSVGWPEVLTALTLTAEGEGEAADVAALESSSGVSLPVSVRKFLSMAGVRHAIIRIHPNNPRLSSAQSWKIWTDPAQHRMGGALAMPLVRPYSGGHSWWVTWDPGDKDAQVSIRFANGTIKPVAPDLAFFLWDLNNTGLAWEASTGNTRRVPEG
jgi:hypothetical protein